MKSSVYYNPVPCYGKFWLWNYCLKYGKWSENFLWSNKFVELIKNIFFSSSCDLEITLPLTSSFFNLASMRFCTQQMLITFLLTYFQIHASPFEDFDGCWQRFFFLVLKFRSRRIFIVDFVTHSFIVEKKIITNI